MPFSYLPIIILGTFAVSASACFPKREVVNRKEDQRRPAYDMPVENDGVVTMTIKPDAKVTQYIHAASGSSIESAQVIIPPGAINVAMKISIEEASSIATPATVGHLELDNSFLNAGKAVGLTADINADAAKPFILSLPIPGAKLRLAGDSLDTLSVVFKVKIAATDEIKTGIIPRKDLIIENDVIKVATIHFGVYQAVITEKLLAEKVETKINNDLQMKREEKTLPRLEVLGRQPVVVKQGETITLTGKNFRPTMTLAWNGNPITKLKYMSDSQVSFTAPNQGSLGLLALNVEQEGSSSSVSLVFQGDGSTLVSSFSPSQVCNDITYFDLNGKSQQGTRNCSGIPPTPCSTDGDVNCMANESFKAADMTHVVAGNIKSGATIAGVSGNAIVEAHDDCSGDGQFDCIATTQYPSVDTTTYSAWDIRQGITIGGTSGSFFFPKNMVMTSTFDRKTGSGSSTGADIYDTIDDYNNSGAFPSTSAGSWPVMTGNNWMMEVSGDTVDANGLCDDEEVCIFKDYITNLMWAQSDPNAGYSWDNAIALCNNLSLGGYHDWRLPTQKELMQAYTNGIWSQSAANKLNLSTVNHWTATTSSENTSNAYYISLALGKVESYSKSSTIRALCVR